MNNCPNCGKVLGLHSSILQGCMCQHSMQEPPQRTWVGLTDEDKHEIELRAGITEDDDGYIVSQVFKLTEVKLKQKNGYAEEKNNGV